MPIILQIETGTDNQIYYQINPLALLLLQAGWELQLVVLPEMSIL